MRRGSAYPVAVLFVLYILTCPIHSAMGGSISYGDMDDFLGGGNVEYINITETSDAIPPSLYEAPSVSVDTLDFSPNIFGTSASSGQSANLSGVASFGIRPMAGYYINEVALQEAGDYTMFGSGTSDTFLQLSAPITLTITEVDGAPITPVVVSSALAMAPNPSGRYDLVSDAGINILWQGDLVIDIDLELTLAGVTYTYGATEVDVSLGNTMATETEAASSVLVRKSDTSAIATVSLPEPSTVTLALLGLSGLLLARRRR